MWIANSWCILIWISFFAISVYDAGAGATNTLPYCNSAVKDRSLLFVSTLDGIFTALNTRNGGLEEWNVFTTPGPMLSSSMHKLELSENSQWVRMIPSLSGGLYKFNGEYIQPVPVNADNLLGSSFRFSDDVMISGGKEVRSYGIDVASGQVLYECSMSKCDNFTDSVNTSSDDMVLLQRDTRTVRAIEPRTGTERWNFSVAQHDVKLLYNPLPECNIDFSPAFDMDIKVVVPDGLIVALNKSNPEMVVWQHKFESPIASVWSLAGYQIQWIDLFSVSYTTSKVKMDPTVYVGMHNKQLYIQESTILREHLQQQTNGIISTEDQFPKILWIPFPANEDGLLIKSDSDLKGGTPELTDESTSTTALSVLYGSDYVNGNGYYLYDVRLHNNSRVAKKCKKRNISEQMHLENVKTVQPKLIAHLSEEEDVIIPTIASLSHWWKEILIISIATAFVLNFICFQYIQHYILYFKETMMERSATKKRMSTSSNSTNGDSGIASINGNDCDDGLSSNTTAYRSRYLEDFEPIHVLGKGGFGVVFQAKNKIDDCHYAVKRITLPNRKDARERVMREVKALAKLEHRNIVRYFNAWQECPPIGWQEEHDKTWKDKSSIDFLSSIEESTKYGSEKPPDSDARGNEKSSKLWNFSMRDINKYLHSKMQSPKSADHSDDSFVVFKSNTAESSTAASSAAAGIDFVKLQKDNIIKDEKSFFDFQKGTTDNNIKENEDGESCVKIQRIYLYIQMQLCQRNSLREWLQDNHNRERCAVLEMFLQIVQAVEYVHLQGLIHRDLKPSNIFFSAEDEIKIGDFGLATAMADPEFSNKDSSSQRSKKNARHTANVGTELYMSPEQMEGNSYNYKVDIYSLGIIFFELLIPFSTQMERYETLTNLRNSVYPLNFENAHTDECRLLRKMLSRYPAERPTTYDIKSRPPLCNLYGNSISKNNSITTNSIKSIPNSHPNPFSVFPYPSCEINIES